MNFIGNMMSTHNPRLCLAFSLGILIAVSGCGGGSESHPELVSARTREPDPQKGKPLFLQTCSACHGVDAKGLPNLGKGLVGSEFVHTNSLDGLVQFILQGRPVNHPDNTTGVPMLPKGGNPALTEDQIRDIAAYVKSIN